MPIRVGSGRPFFGSQLGALAGQERCVLSDTPIVLIEMNVLSRDLRNGCPLHPDVTGYTYEGELALGPQDQLLARRKNPAWQKQVLGYLTSGNAVLLARRKGTGLDRASMQAIKRWPVLARINGYSLFARAGGQPGAASPNAPKRSGAAAASRKGRAATRRETE